MRIELTRRWFTDKSTISEFYVNGTRECFSLEDVDRMEESLENTKIHGETAIPAGEYEVVRLFSPHFARLMPYLVNVPKFSGVMIHWGTLPKDTLGCILLGNKRDVDQLHDSKNAFDHFDKQFNVAIDAKEKVTISIGSDPEN